MFRRLVWKAPKRSRSLVTQYQVTYRMGDSEKYEQWLKRDRRSLVLTCSARNRMHGIDVRPYCGDVVKGPGVTATTQCLTGEGKQGTAAKAKIEDAGASCGWIMLMDGNDANWQPGGIAVMSDGRLLVTDMDNNCLRLSAPASTLKGQFQLFYLIDMHINIRK